MCGFTLFLLEHFDSKYMNRYAFVIKLNERLFNTNLAYTHIGNLECDYCGII